MNDALFGKSWTDIFIFRPKAELLLCKLAKKFIEKYGVDTDHYDVIKGWRTNALYFYIAKEFVRDNIDIDILEELLSLGKLGIQHCIKSELAYTKLHELPDSLMTVDSTEFNEKYNQ